MKEPDANGAIQTLLDRPRGFAVSRVVSGQKRKKKEKEKKRKKEANINSKWEYRDCIVM